MKLWPRRRSEERSDPVISMQDWADMFKWNGLVYPSYSIDNSTNVEELGTDYVAFAQQAYQANGIVFACMALRMRVFTEARFQYQQLRKGRPADLFTKPALELLERPWPNGTTGELLARALQDADLAGNHYAAREPGRVRWLRPDWVDIILTEPPDQAVQCDVAGYLYRPGGRGGKGKPRLYLPEEIAHWSPIPDPLAQYRGMSWLTPIVREIMSDREMQKHKGKYFANAATPNLAVSFKETVTKAQFQEFMEAFNRAHQGTHNAYKTLDLGGGADVTPIGADMRMMDFKSVEGSGENRIAAAAGTPPVLVGLSEGLQGSSLNAGNFNSARDWFGNMTMRPLWRSIAAAYEGSLVPREANSRLWYDDRDIPALRQDRKVAADIQAEQAATMVKLITAGFVPKTVGPAVMSEDWTLLEHSGLISVQLLPPGTVAKPPAPPAPEPTPAQPPATAPGSQPKPAVPKPQPPKPTPPPTPPGKAQPPKQGS